MVERQLGNSFVTANKLVEQLAALEILKETTGAQRNRRYAYAPYLALFESSATHDSGKGPETKTTGSVQPSTGL